MDPNPANDKAVPEGGRGRGRGRGSGAGRIVINLNTGKMEMRKESKWGRILRNEDQTPGERVDFDSPAPPEQPRKVLGREPPVPINTTLPPAPQVPIVPPTPVQRPPTLPDIRRPLIPAPIEITIQNITEEGYNKLVEDFRKDPTHNPTLSKYKALLFQDQNRFGPPLPLPYSVAKAVQGQVESVVPLANPANGRALPSLKQYEFLRDAYNKVASGDVTQRTPTNIQSFQLAKALLVFEGERALTYTEATAKAQLNLLQGFLTAQAPAPLPQTVPMVIQTESEGPPPTKKRGRAKGSKNKPNPKKQTVNDIREAFYSEVVTMQDPDSEKAGKHGLFLMPVQFSFDCRISDVEIKIPQMSKEDPKALVAASKTVYGNIFQAQKFQVGPSEVFEEEDEYPFFMEEEIVPPQLERVQREIEPEFDINRFDWENEY